MNTFHFLHFMDNEGSYSVGKGMRKGTLKNNQAKSFAGHLRLILSHGLVASQVAKTTSS